MKSEPRPENSIVLRFVAPKAAAAASNVGLASCASANPTLNAVATSTTINVFFIDAPALHFNRFGENKKTYVTVSGTVNVRVGFICTWAPGELIHIIFLL